MILKEHQYDTTDLKELNIGRFPWMGSTKSGTVYFYLVLKNPGMLHNSESTSQN
jgi:hypothetical protein